jgi:hypothetical protein
MFSPCQSSREQVLLRHLLLASAPALRWRAGRRHAMAAGARRAGRCLAEPACAASVMMVQAAFLHSVAGSSITFCELLAIAAAACSNVACRMS